MDILSILSIIAGGFGSLITIGTFFTLVCKPLREKFTGWIRKITDREKIDKEMADLNDKITREINNVNEKLTKEINSINDKIDKLTSLVEKTIEQNEKLQAEMDLQSKALLSDTRKIILDMCTKITNKGYMTMYESETLSSLWESYDGLHGNSFVHKMVKRVFDNIPVKKNEGDE